MKTIRTWLAVALLSLPAMAADKPILMVVMDPLAKELACACVEGRGQRNYRKLATDLGAHLQRPIKIEFSDDLADTLSLVEHGPEIIVIGEHATVAHGAKAAKLKLSPVCALTDPDGLTSLRGSFVVRASDPAKKLQDLKDRPIFFGMADVSVNHAAIRSALQKAGVATPDEPEDTGDYANMVLDVLDSDDEPAPIGVIPSYALPLLTGCGSVKPGEVRVVGQTDLLPFISVFLSSGLAPKTQDEITQRLLALRSDAGLLKALESRHGFQRLAPRESQADWPDWRGTRRAGRVPSLPERLPTERHIVWKKPAMTDALSGLTISGNKLLIAERDLDDKRDVYRCLNTVNGEEYWRVEFTAEGELDYGQSPRATPVVQDGRAYLLGTFGELRCVDMTSGKVIWKRDLPKDFQVNLPTWGMSSPPLMVNERLIVNPGSPSASLAAVDTKTGKSLWTAEGKPAAYAPFILGNFGGRQQIVGYDQTSLGGWDPETGQRLWELVPWASGDFNVPTPIEIDGKLLVTTENNGTRLFQFDPAGKIRRIPVARFEDLASETSTPVVTNGRVFGAADKLYCLDLNNFLKPIWTLDEIDLGDHAALIADDERVLVITMSGELVLLDAKADANPVISRLRAFDADVDVYSHPALIGTRLFIRGGYRIICLELDPAKKAKSS